jgi:RNA polymerase I-specific transcription initiation factor RRN7
MIVKDLWTYQLAISALPPPPEDTASRPDSGPSSVRPQPKSQTSKGTLGKASAAGSDDSDTGEPEVDGSDKSDQDNEAGVDLDLLEEMSHLSELSDKEEGYDPAGRRGGNGKTRGRKKRRLKVSDTLVVLSLGLWMLRRGTMCVEMEK